MYDAEMRDIEGERERGREARGRNKKRMSIMRNQKYQHAHRRVSTNSKQKNTRCHREDMMAIATAEAAAYPFRHFIHANPHFV